MAEAPAKHRIQRILVALDATEQGRATVETAAQLAARLEAEVVGLFVEDINLLRLAALPFAREMGFGSTRRRALDPSHMERALRAQAEALRRELAACADRARIPWSFQVRRGVRHEELLNTVSEVDLVVIGESGEAIVSAEAPARLSQRLLLQCSCALLKAGGGRRRLEHPVVLFYDGSQACRRALALAARLAAGQAHRLHVLLPPEAASQEALVREARALLGEAAARACFQTLPDLRAATLAQAVRTIGGDILITGAALPLTDRQRLESLLEEIHCDLLLVR